MATALNGQIQEFQNMAYNLNDGIKNLQKQPVSNAPCPAGYTALQRACRRGTARAVNKLLETASANSFSYLKSFIEQPSVDGWVALDQACGTKVSSLEKVQLLLDYSADIDALETESPSIRKPKTTPLLNSIQLNNHHIISLLLEKGARTDVNDAQEMSILHLTACTGDIETLTILNLERLDGTKFQGHNDKDAFGNTPLQAFDVMRAEYINEDDSTRRRIREIFLQLLEDPNGQFHEIEDDSNESSLGQNPHFIGDNGEEMDLFLEVEQDPEGPLGKRRSGSSWI